jgi:molybdate transport system substrate-binding protein
LSRCVSFNVNRFLAKIFRVSLWLACYCLSFLVQADQLKIAVASNFIEPMRELVRVFESKTKHKILTSYGSSGKLTIQIEQGAPFDILMSADADKPNRLVTLSLAEKEHQQTYAIGRLALVSHTKNVSMQSLCSSTQTKLSIANPLLAPYGKASTDYIERLPCHLALKKQIILGENIAQAFHFFVSGAADFALIALSQVQTKPELIASYWLIPEALHKPIVQDMVILKQSQHQDAAYQWLNFIQSNQAKKIIQSFGYQ